MGVHNKSVRRPHALRPQPRIVGLRDPWLEIQPQFQPALLRLSAIISHSFTPGACALLIVLRHLRSGLLASSCRCARFIFFCRSPTDPSALPRARSARRHCTSPRRGRRVEWSHQRSGIVRLHFRARRSCRRSASEASYESMENAGSIEVTTTDVSLVTDSV